MFCSKCGSKIPDDSRFCENCGKETSRNNPGKLLVPVIPVSSQAPVYGQDNITANEDQTQIPSEPVNSSKERTSSLSDRTRVKIIKIASIASFILVVIVLTELEQKHRFSLLLTGLSNLNVAAFIFVSIKKNIGKHLFILILIGLIAISCVALLYLL